MLAVAALVAMGQTKVVWEDLMKSYSPNPQFEINKVELTPEKTTLYASYNNSPTSWFLISKESYLESDGKKYAIIGSDSITLGEQHHTDEETWTKEFVLYFKPLPPDTKEFDFMEGTAPNDFKVFSIHEKSYTMPVTPVPEEYLADYAEDDVMEDLKYSDQPATMVQYVDLKNPAEPVDAKVRLNDDGEADLSLPICFPQVVYATLYNIPWASFCVLYLAPGKEVTVLIDMLQDESGINSKFVGFKGYFARFDKEFDSTAEDVESGYKEQKDKYPKWEDIHDVQTLMDACKKQMSIDLDIYKGLSCSKTIMDYFFAEAYTPPLDLMYVADSLKQTKGFKDYIRQYYTKNLYSPKAVFGNGFVDASKYYVMADARGINADLARYCYYLPQVLDGKDVPKPLIEDKNLSDLYDKYVTEYKQRVASNKEKVTGDDHIHYLDMTDISPDSILSTILDRYKGKTALIDIWATWCGPCRVAIDQMKPMKQELEGKDIVYIYMTSSTSEFDTWKDLIPDIHGEHYYLTEEQLNHILQQYGEQAYPTYAIYNSKGERTYLTTGFPGVEAMKKELEKATK